MKIIGGLLLVLAIAGGLFYHHYFNAAAVLERRTQQTLEQFSAVVETADRVRIGDALKALLTDDAKIRLEVINFVTLAHVSGRQQDAQDFDKSAFVSFIDNLLYSVNSAHYEAMITEFHLDPDRKAASVHFSGKVLAEGVSYYSGTAVQMRFTSDSSCAGRVQFAGNGVLLQQADCQVSLRSIPKPGEAEKLRDPAAIRQMLQ